jgi:lipoprotein-releasing system permease protein
VDATDVSLGKNLNGRRDKYGSVYMTQSVKNHPHTASAFAWLEVLNTNVWIILVLMVCVAGFTMISGLLILILERTTTIGILKAMGMTNQKIRSTFISYAAMIMMKDCLWGNVIGLGVIGLQKYFGWVKLDPQSYYVSTAPVLLNWTWIISLNIATLFITVMALLVPSLVVTRIQPAKSIKFE